MLTDAMFLANGSTLETDVCVIGAGPAGITIALELARTGLDVVVLESGGVAPERDQRGADGQNADPRYYRLRRSRVVGFGGSSNHWMHTSGMRARPLDNIDLVERPEIGRGGWPISPDELYGYYPRANEICRLGPFAYGLDDILEPGRQPLPLDPDIVESVAFRVAALGNFPGRLPEVVSAPNVRLLVHATALHLNTAASGTSVSDVPVAAGDVRLTVRPRATVVAGGGLENARLLQLTHQRSVTALEPVADQVGRHLMEHPHVRTGIIVPETHLDLEQLGLYEVSPATTGTFAMLALPPERVREERLLNVAWTVAAAPAAQVSRAGRALVGLRESVTEFRRPIPGTRDRLVTVFGNPGEAIRAVKAARSGTGHGHQVLTLTTMAEQEPNPASRVTLGSRRDVYGRPQISVDWQLTDLDLRTISRSQELIGEAFRDAGLGRLTEAFGTERPPAILGGGFHHIGTTRMGSGPECSVVDPDLRVHGFDDLYVAGMSVFPTAGFANPTLTVVALAVRLAAHLRDELSETP